MEHTDADLVRRAMVGQKDAFGLLIDLHRDVVFSICFSRCRNFTDAQDLAQEAFIKAYTNLHQLREPEKFASWLYRITYAVCTDWFREYKHVSIPFDETTTISLPMQPVDDEFLRRETRHLVCDALAQLPEKQRLAATLHYLCGYTCEEIGRFMNFKATAIKEVLRGARHRLRNHLFERMFEDAKVQKPGKSLTRKVLSGLASFEKEETFSHMRALKALLEFYGCKVDWDYLLGASGEAFCMYFSPSWTYLSRFVHSWDVLNSACSAYGYEGAWSLNAEFEQALSLIENSFQQGAPIAAPGINPSVEEDRSSESHYWFVITGLNRKKKQFSLSGVGEQHSEVPFPWLVRRNDYGWAGIVRCLDVYPRFLAWNPLFSITASEKALNPEEVALDSFRRAIRLANEETIKLHDDEPVEMCAGMRALNAWSRSLRESADVDLSHHITTRASHCSHHGSVMYAATRQLEDARRAAAAYVHRLAESNMQLPESDLIDAANRYENTADAARRLFELYFDPAEEMEMQKAVSRYPKPKYYSCDETVRFWNTFTERFYDDPAQRRAGAELICEIEENEKSAVRILDKLIAEWG